jgi:uncharacterized protein
MKDADFMVYFDQVPPEGMERHLEIADAGEAGLELAVPLEKPLRADLALTRHGERIRVRGALEASVRLECSRCLQQYVLPLQGELEVFLETGGEDSEEEEKELSREEMEVRFLKRKTIDLRDLLAEQVHLSLPFKPLCADNCKGMCPRCGTDLDQGQCSCGGEGTDPRWEALKQLKAK